MLERQQKFLHELRQQVALGVAMGLPRPMIVSRSRLPNSYFVWMPYDTPSADDILHVYRELTVLNAPFGNNPPERNNTQPHVLVLIGDRVHEPEHLEEGLRPVFEATRVVLHFTVDFRVVTGENLARVSLFVILRDGMIWPEGDEKPYQMWITPEQEQAVQQFVEYNGVKIVVRYVGRKGCRGRIMIDAPGGALFS